MSSGKIILKCVKAAGKLRIRFHHYVDTEGKVYANAYNDTYNCQFPRDIRAEGKYYEIPEDDLKLSRGPSAPFYVVGKKNIKIIETDPAEALKDIKIFAIEECVICLADKPNRVYIPCGHQCVCSTCDSPASLKKCPLCRRQIADRIAKED